MAELRSIVYLSTAVSLFTEQELESLLVTARRSNLENGITGVLLYSDGNFMQCLEGSQASVQSTYDRILASRKHKNVVKLLDRGIAARSFADWQMGFAQPTKSELLALTTARWKEMSAGPPISAATAPGLALLQRFWQRTRK
jgi:Sensors of blue-light using FAD